MIHIQAYQVPLVTVFIQLRQLLHTYHGRDKLFKVAQYVMKLLLWARGIDQKDFDPFATDQDSLNRYTALERNIVTVQNGRRMFRLGRFIGEGYRIRQTLMKCADMYAYAYRSSKVLLFVESQMVVDIVTRTCLFLKSIYDDIAFFSRKDILHPNLFVQAEAQSFKFVFPAILGELYLNTARLLQGWYDAVNAGVHGSRARSAVLSTNTSITNTGSQSRLPNFFPCEPPAVDDNTDYSQVASPVIAPNIMVPLTETTTSPPILASTPPLTGPQSSFVALGGNSNAGSFSHAPTTPNITMPPLPPSSGLPPAMTHSTGGHHTRQSSFGQHQPGVTFSLYSHFERIDRLRKHNVSGASEAQRRSDHNDLRSVANAAAAHVRSRQGRRRSFVTDSPVMVSTPMHRPIEGGTLATWLLAPLESDGDPQQVSDAATPLYGLPRQQSGAMCSVTPPSGVAQWLHPKGPGYTVRSMLLDREVYWVIVTELKLLLDLFAILCRRYRWNVSEGVISLCGVISGLLSVHRVWVYGR